MSGEPLFEGVSENASGEVPAGAALVSPEETARLVKNLTAVLPVGIARGLLGIPPGSCCPLAPPCAAASSVCLHGLLLPVSFQ